MTVLSKLPFFWLVMSVTTVGLLSYVVSLAFNRIFDKDGFGTIGNMIVLTAGFFGGIVAAEYFGHTFRGLQMNTYVGIAGALATFVVAALLAKLFDRIIR